MPATGTAVAVEPSLAWYCCHTADGAQALRNLSDQGFRVFWPRYWDLDHNHKPVVRSLFGPYLFPALDRSDPSWRTIPNTRGIRRLISLHSEYPLEVPAIALQPFLDTYGSTGLLPYVAPVTRIVKPHWRQLWEVSAEQIGIG